MEREKKDNGRAKGERVKREKRVYEDVIEMESEEREGRRRGNGKRGERRA